MLKSINTLGLNKCRMVKWTRELRTWTNINLSTTFYLSNKSKFHCRCLSDIGARKKVSDDGISNSNSNNEVKVTKKKKQRIIIRASDVAAIIGKNTYKPPYEVFDDMWKKYSPDTFQGKTELDLAQESLSKASEEEISLITKAFQYKSKDSLDANSQIKIVEEKIIQSKTLSTEDKERVMSLVRGTISTNFGIKTESITVAKVEIEEKIEIKKDESYYTYPICSIGNMRFDIVGKIDGIEEENGQNVLIEIKNRINRLRKRVPEYEFVQVQTYLAMIGLDKAKLIEQYQQETHTEVILADNDYWNYTILPELKRFCIEFQRKTTLTPFLSLDVQAPSPRSDSDNEIEK